MDVFLGALIIVLGVVGVFAGAVILRGFVLSQLWGWFVVSTLNAPHISIGEAIGLALVISFFTAPFAREKESKYLPFLAPLTALGMGYVLHNVFGVGA